jgi:UDP:flavonoid glycosyltransferase YjiC (YdhE family)
VNGTGGASPDWPPGEKRIYAYLKAFPTLNDLLALLKQRGHSTIVYSAEIGRKAIAEYQSETLRFVSEPLNMSEVGRDCDLAILNAGHGTTCDILLAGKPIMQIPMNAEQQLMAERVCALGAGERVSARKSDPERMAAALDQLLTDPKYTQAAQTFAKRYAKFDPQKQRAQMLERVLELLEGPVTPDSFQASPPASPALNIAGINTSCL